MIKFIFSMLFLLFIGCGGGGDTGSNAEFSPEMTITNMQIQKDADNNILNLSGNISFKEKNTYFSNATFSNISAVLDGCNIESTTIDPATLADSKTGTFNIKLSPGCKSIYQLGFKGKENAQYIDTNVKTKTDTFNLYKSVIISTSQLDNNTTTTDTNETIPTTTNQSALVVNNDVNMSQYVGDLTIDPRNVDVTTSSSQFTFNIQAISKDGKSYISNALIQPIALIDENGNTLGYFNQNLYMTDSNGVAHIIYTAPSDISTISGQKIMKFKLFDTNITVSAVLNFTQNNANVAHLSLIPNDISILEPKMTQQIKIIATDKDFFPVSGANIVFSTMHDDKNILGEFNTKSITTDKNGEAIITYTAPNDITNLNTKATALFMLKDNSDINTTLIARFENGISNLDRIVVTPNNINILSPNQIQNVVVLAIDKNNNPMKNVKIDIEALVDDNNLSYGSVDKYQITTDENGKASVTYTAPQNINFDSNKTIVFKLDNNTSIQTKVNVTFQNQTNVAKIIFDPSVINVNQANVNQPIKILTVDKDNKPVSALVSLNVPVDENNNTFGSLDTYQVRTNENGEAIVTYTSPTDISKVIGTQTITAKIVNTSIENKIKVNFNADKATHLVLDPKNIEVTKGFTKTIRITAFNDNNLTVSGVKLQVKMPVLNNGLSIGKFNTYNITTNENGEALLTYTAPDNITMLQGDAYTVEILSENNVKSELSLKFTKPDSVKYFYVFPSNSVRITQNNQEEKFKVITLDENKRPIQANVLINKLVTKDSTTEFGSMDKYQVRTDENGEALLTYTAPDNINTIDGNQTIVFKIDNTELEKNVTLEFLKDKNISDYKITLVKQNSYEVDEKGSFTVNIVKKDNENEYISNADVINVNITTINQLINFDGNNEYEYNNSSSKAIAFKAGIYSGVELVEIKALVKYGDNNITITNTFNVVISAGEISAMSINYLGTQLNTSTGLYEENYAIHAVDKYSNPVKAGTKIYIGAINKAKIYGDNNGSISYNKDINKTEFNTTYDNNKYGIESQDSLIVLANKDRNKETYLGGWHITDINDTNVTLYEKYSDIPVDKLTFVIGNEKRTDVCENTVKLIDFDSKNHTYEVDENGVAYIKAKYDPYMVGKTVSFYANSLSQTHKVGTSIKKVLKGTEIISTSLADGWDTEDNYIDPLTAHVFKFKLTQNINGRKIPLKNVKIGTDNVKGLNVLSTDISKSGFSVVCDVINDRKADLNKVFIKDIDVDTGCDGEVSITIENNDSYYYTYCKVSWNNEIIPEYGADLNVTHEVVQTTTPNTKVVKLAIEPDSEVITQNSQIQPIKIVAVDQYNKVVSNAQINVLGLVDKDGKVFGSLDNYLITTNTKGEAYVTYTAPSDISDFIGKDRNITFRLDINDTNTIEINNTIKFRSTKNNDKVSSIIVDPNSFKVNLPTDKKDLLLTAKDNNGNVVSGAVIDIKVLQKDGISYGSMSSYSVITDDNGQAKVTYFAPQNIFDVNGDKNITFDVRGYEVEKNVSVQFVKLAKIIPTPISFNVKTGSQIQNIGIQVVDENHHVAPNVNVKVEGLNDGLVSFGDMDSYSVVTDNNGMAYIKYTAPSSLKDIIDNNITEENITLYIDGTDIEQNITINFTKPEVSSIFTDPKNFVVSNESKTIKVVTLADDNTTPISTNVNIDMLVAQNGDLVGTFDKYEFNTDNNGEATVTFTPTSDISLFEGNKTIEFKTENNKSTKLTLQFLPQKTVSKLVVIPSYIKITENNQQQQFKIIALDNSNRGISTKIDMNRLLDDENNEYGTLDKYSVTTDDTGEAIINYTAPDNKDNFDGNYSIDFKVEGMPVETNATLEFLKPETNATEYMVQLIVPDSFAVDSKDSFTVKIVEKSDTTKYIQDNKVNDVNVSVVNNLISFESNETNNSYEYNDSSSKSIDIYSNIHSGIEFVDVNASIDNGEENVTISQRFKVVVISGPISSISINYLGTEYDNNDGLFIERYAVHAVDKYSNPANAGSRIYMGAINGNKINKDKNGTIDFNNDKNVTEFNVTNVNLKDAGVEENDVVTILANNDRLDSSYLGGWTIKELIADSNLTLNEKYTGDKVDLLSYVIGNEKRYDSCSDSIRLIDFNSTNGSYEVGANGIAYISAKYDPFLVGKTISFYANADSNKRVGVSVKKILEGTGTTTNPTTITVTNDTNSSADGNVSMQFNINNANMFLQNTHLTKDNFIFVNGSSTGCKYTDINVTTDCNGIYWIQVTVPANSKCIVKWNSTFTEEY